VLGGSTLLTKDTLADLFLLFLYGKLGIFAAYSSSLLMPVFAPTLIC